MRCDEAGAVRSRSLGSFDPFDTIRTLLGSDSQISYVSPLTGYFSRSNFSSARSTMISPFHHGVPGQITEKNSVKNSRAIKHRRGARTTCCCTAQDRDQDLNFPPPQSDVVLELSDWSANINTLRHPRLVPKNMSGLHVVQCLCHGQVFLGRVMHTPGDLALQVSPLPQLSLPRSHSPFLSPALGSIHPSRAPSTAHNVLHRPLRSLQPTDSRSSTHS